MTDPETTSTPKKKDKKKDNLTAEPFPKELKWSQSERDKSLKQIYDFVNTECKNAINWYYKRKKLNKFWGYYLRFFAILAVAISGVIPILGEIYEEGDIPSISPAWATVSLATAAFFVALDQLAGYSTGWVRYIRTAQKLTMLQGNFRLEWEQYCLTRNDNSINSEIIKEGIEHCKNFLKDVNSAVQAETDAWAQEFQQALLELDQQKKVK